MSLPTRFASPLLALALAGAAVAAPEPAPAATPYDAAGLAGQVTAATSPLASAWVYAYQIADLRIERVATDADGRFAFDGLPAGLYKIIAYKSGFVPAVAMLSRATAQARQFMDLELAPVPVGDAAQEDFWAARERIPPDVLRDLEIVVHGRGLAGSTRTEVLADAAANFRGEMQAIAGVREGREFGEAQMSGGRVGIDGQIRDVKIGVAGRYAELQSQVLDQAAVGRTQWLSVQVERSESSRVDLTSWSNELDTFRPRGRPDSVAFESHSVRWSQRFGEAESAFTAQYTEQNNFHRQGKHEPMEIPDASRTFRFEGSYVTPVTGRSTVEAGIRYRDLDGEYGLMPQTLDALPTETVEVYGRAGMELKPALVVEYGLFSKLRGGGVSLYPQGGLIVRLGDHWQASSLASYRAHQDVRDDRLGDFMPVFHSDSTPCSLGEEYCYQLLLSRLWGNDESFSIGAVHRQFGDTLRLYFDRDFFNRLESLFLVEGDQVPEVQLGLTRRLTPDILTRLESSLAAGGGGMVQTADRAMYENQVRYLVTSLDTQFEQTATGVFLAFHRLQQSLSPVDAPPRRRDPALELERLQVMLTQDLGILHQMAWDWAVHLNMEVSRGTTTRRSVLPDDELLKRLTGGIAVRF